THRQTPPTGRYRQTGGTTSDLRDGRAPPAGAPIDHDARDHARRPHRRTHLQRRRRQPTRRSPLRLGLRQSASAAQTQPEDDTSLLGKCTVCTTAAEPGSLRLRRCGAGKRLGVARSHKELIEAVNRFVGGCRLAKDQLLKNEAVLRSEDETRECWVVVEA